jgi:hypothetical protein
MRSGLAAQGVPSCLLNELAHRRVLSILSVGIFEHPDFERLEG